MIAQARIAMFEKSRPAIQGRHVPPSVAVEPKTELPMKAKRSSFPILVK
jgi:glutathione synthase/RimK-type ligase-like ATP-grasp enzyme